MDVEKPDLPYRYEFAADELEAIRACHDEHGFAVVKGVLDAQTVEALKDSVRQALDPEETLKPGETRVKHAFVEYSEPLVGLLEHRTFMRVNECLLGTEEFSLHRSAAILKAPGSGPVTWHTDWHGFTPPPPQSANEVLNRGEWPNGMWFYLNGTHPARAGLAVVADSHRLDWEGPEGFALTEHRRSFHRPGEEAKAYDRFDMPGLVPLFTDPGDLIVFAARTYHGAYAHGGDEPRLSCGLIFRQGREPLGEPWEKPLSARRFIEGLPARLRPYAEHYPGFDGDWRPGA